MPIDLTIDVTEAAGLGEPLRTRVTVVLPEPEALADPPVVCFGFPGGGYSRGYFTFDMPGADGGGEAGWHAARGWVFVACDHLFVGESDAPSDPTALTLERIAATNHATVTEVLRLLAAGEVADGFPPLADPVKLGIGQSMGGCFTIVQQGQHRHLRRHRRPRATRRSRPCSGCPRVRPTRGPPSCPAGRTSS